MNDANSSLMKNHLADTLKELSKGKDLEKLSVGDIVKASGVNRSTFYYHFKDKDDLIQYIFESDVTRWYVPAEHGGKWVHNTRKLLNILHRDRAFYLQALKIDSVNNLRNIFFKTSYSTASHFIDHYLDGRELDPASKDFIAAFYANAHAGMNMGYIRAGAKESPEKTALRFFDVCEPGIQHAIENCLRRYEEEQ